MLASLLALQLASAETLRVPSLPVTVEVPEEEGVMPAWSHTLGDATTEVKLAMRNLEAYSDAAITATAYQPDMELVREAVQEQLAQNDDDVLEITPGELEDIEHEKLGRMFVMPLQVHDTWMEQDLLARVAFFSVAGAGVSLTVKTSKVDDPEHVKLVMDEVLDMITVDTPPVPAEELPRGRVSAEAGYDITLPNGWRALTLDESRRLSNDRVGGESEFSGALADFYVVDESQLAKQTFKCRTQVDATLEVLDPERSEVARENFLTFSRVMLRGGKVEIVTGTEEIYLDVLADNPIQPRDDGQIDFVHLDDERDAYLWKVEGTLFDDPVTAALFYTAYGELGLTCIAFAEEGDDALLGSFESAVTQLDIRDGASHPMPLSVKAKYTRWWPYSNPLLQLYWAPVPLFLLAGWLIFKD